MLLNHDASQPWDETALDALDRLEKFVVDSYGSRDPDLTQLFTPTKRLRIRPHFKLAKEWIDFGLDLERLPVSDLPRVVTEVNQKVTEAVLASLNPKHKYFICFDELDRGFDPTARTYTDMLIGLVLAAKLLNERARDSERQFSVVIFLRDDIYEVLRFEDKNKVTEALASVIAWDLPGEEWTLRRLMERRFIKVLGEGTDVAWSEVFDEDHQMPGRQTKYRHILDRTFNRPRDIIKFCNEVLKRYRARSGDGKFENRDVLEARSAYSDYLLRELGDEAHKHWPQYQECLEVLRAVGTAVFSHEELTKACVKRPGLLPDGIAPIEALRRLFDFSVVAYQKAGGAGGGSAYVWRYLDQRARFDESATYFRVHPGLIEALGLKRYSHKAGEDEEADAG